MKQLIENADVVINVGVRLTRPPYRRFHASFAGGKMHYSTVRSRSGGSALAPHSDARGGAGAAPPEPVAGVTLAVAADRPPDAAGNRWGRAGSARLLAADTEDFLRPGDIVLADQGTACFGAAARCRCRGCRLIGGAGGIDRLYPAGDVRRTDRRTAAAGNIADRRRRRAADRTGTGIDAARRA